MSGRKIICVLTAAILVLSNLLSLNKVEASTDTKSFTISEDGVLEKYVGNDKIVTVPDTVKQIGPEAFKNCTRIEQIILPEGVTEIGNGAFRDCSMLAQISLPSTLTSFSSNSIEGCNQLKEITIPKGVSLMQWDYYQSNGLESVNVDAENESFSSIDGVIFNKEGTILLHYPQNKKDKAYKLPESVTDISQADFNRAKYLKNITFNSKVTRSIMDNGFADVDGSSFLNGVLESFTVPKENKTFCDINGVLFTKDKKTLIAYPEKKTGKAYIVPSGTQIIEYMAFSKSSDTELNLKYILIPASVTEIKADVAAVWYYEGIGHNTDISLFGKKGSVVETYATQKDNINFGLKFGYYDSSKKGEQVLINATDLVLGKGRLFDLDAVVLPLTSNQAVTFTSSNEKVATVTVDGYIIANELGEATITAKSKSGKSVSCTVSVKLPEPVLNVESTSSTAIKLTWTKIKGAVSYTVYRMDPFVDNDYIAIGTVTGNSYSDKTFSKDALFYYYKVVANHKNSKYNSAKSMMVQVKIADLGN